MKKLFRWFALSLLVGAMAFAGLGSASAEDEDDGWGPCGYVQNNNTSITVVSHCNPCPSGFGVPVTALGGSIKALVCPGV